MNKIRKEIILNASSETAFKNFLYHIDKWWPKEYTWSQEKLVEIKIDPKEDGLCTEIGPFNFRCDWGRLLEIENNYRIVIKWQISPKREPVPNPERSSEIELKFLNNGNSNTTLEFEHRNFKSHGEGWKEYMEALDSNIGWNYILNKFKDFCETK